MEIILGGPTQVTSPHDINCTNWRASTFGEPCSRIMLLLYIKLHLTSRASSLGHPATINVKETCTRLGRRASSMGSPTNKCISLRGHPHRETLKLACLSNLRDKTNPDVRFQVFVVHIAFNSRLLLRPWKTCAWHRLRISYK